MRRFLILIVLALAGCGVVPTPSPTLTLNPQPTETPTLTPSPTPTPEPTISARTTPTLPERTDSAEIVGPVDAFPGPLHYEGDLITFEAPIGNAAAFPQEGQVTVTVNGEPLGDVFEAAFYHVLLGDRLFVFRAWDTTGYAGTNEVSITVPVNAEGDTQSTTFTMEILPAEARPEQEQRVEWVIRETECCELLYLSGTAAARDIDELAAVADEALVTVEERLGVEAEDLPVPIALIDNVWGNGGYKAAEIVVSYVDRDYTSKSEPELFAMLMVHELTHWVTDPLDQQTSTLLVEGIAVYITGGHYKPEPIPERTAALLETDLYIPLADLADAYRDHQHEVAYIQAAGLVAYLTEAYGWETFLQVYGYQSEESLSPSAWMDEAFQAVYGLTLEEVEADFLVWAATFDPGDQSRDLILTINHFDLLRQYQRDITPYELFPTLEYALDNNLRYRFMRQTTDPTSVAIELMLEELGNAIEAGRYDEAETLYEQAFIAVMEGRFEARPAIDYLEATHLLAEAGYRVESMTFTPEAIIAEVANGPDATLQTITLRLEGGVWTLTE